MPKRLIDILLSLAGLILFLPIGMCISVWIVVNSGWPIFFSQERIGKDSKPFKLYKFRSMKTNNSGALVTAKGDSRITSAGKFLRKYKLDEFPQLWNVLKGDMSIVGPRPEVQKYVNHYSLKEKDVLSVKPGITGVDSLQFSNEEELMAKAENPEEFYINELMPAKLKLSLEYIKNQNLKKAD